MPHVFGVHRFYARADSGIRAIRSASNPNETMNDNVLNDDTLGAAGRQPAAQPGMEPAGADPAPDHLLELLRRAEEETAAMKESFLRARADTENVRRQAQADVAKAHRYGIERFAE